MSDGKTFAALYLSRPNRVDRQAVKFARQGLIAARTNSPIPLPLPPGPQLLLIGPKIALLGSEGQGKPKAVSYA